MSGMQRLAWPKPQFNGAMSTFFTIWRIFASQKYYIRFGVYRFLQSFFIMKKINWFRILFFLLLVGMTVLEGCRLFKPKCDCPHF
jgi:hypothetical protein